MSVTSESGVQRCDDAEKSSAKNSLVFNVILKVGELLSAERRAEFQTVGAATRNVRECFVF